MNINKKLTPIHPHSPEHQTNNNTSQQPIKLQLHSLCLLRKAYLSEYSNTRFISIKKMLYSHSQTYAVCQISQDPKKLLTDIILSLQVMHSRKQIDIDAIRSLIQRAKLAAGSKMYLWASLIYFQAIVAHMTGDFKSAFASLKQLFCQYIRVGTQQLSLVVLRCMLRICRQLHKPQLTLNVLRKMLKLSLYLNAKQSQIFTYWQISNALCSLGELQLAAFYMRLAQSFQNQKDGSQFKQFAIKQHLQQCMYFKEKQFSQQDELNLAFKLRAHQDSNKGEIQQFSCSPQISKIYRRKTKQTVRKFKLNLVSHFIRGPIPKQLSSSHPDDLQKIVFSLGTKNSNIEIMNRGKGSPMLRTHESVPKDLKYFTEWRMPVSKQLPESTWAKLFWIIKEINRNAF